MLVQLAAPLTVAPANVLGRFVVDQMDPLRKIAPSARSAVILSITVSNDVHRLRRPHETSKMFLNDQSKIGQRIQKLFADNNRLFFVICATVGNDGKGNQVITHLEYAEVSKKGDSSYDLILGSW